MRPYKMLAGFFASAWLVLASHARGDDVLDAEIARIASKSLEEIGSKEAPVVIRKSAPDDPAPRAADRGQPLQLVVTNDFWHGEIEGGWVIFKFGPEQINGSGKVSGWKYASGSREGVYVEGNYASGKVKLDGGGPAAGLIIAESVTWSGKFLTNGVLGDEEVRDRFSDPRTRNWYRQNATSPK